MLSKRDAAIIQAAVDFLGTVNAAHSLAKTDKIIYLLEALNSSMKTADDIGMIIEEIEMEIQDTRIEETKDSSRLPDEDSD